MNISESEIVLLKSGVFIDGIEYYEAGSRWSIIVYDKELKEVVGKMKFDI